MLKSKIRLHAKALASVFLFGLASHALAQPVPLSYPFGPAVAIQHADGSIYTDIAGYNNYPGGFPDWKVQQWANQNSLSPATGAASGWTIANSYAALRYYQSLNGHSNVYEFAQGQNVCNLERDMFLSPHGFQSENYRFTPSNTLNNIGSLMIRAGTEVVWAETSSPCSPSQTTIQYVFALVLSSSSGQTLSYQINLGRHPFISQQTSPVSCPGFSGNVFCLDDDVRNVGGSFVTGGDVQHYVEYLPRLIEVIESGLVVNGSGTPFDTNYANWYISGMYSGQIIQGTAVATSRHYDHKVSTMPGGNFCSAGTAVQYVCNAGTPDGSGWGSVGGGCYHRNTGKSCF